MVFLLTSRQEGHLEIRPFLVAILYCEIRWADLPKAQGSWCFCHGFSLLEQTHKNISYFTYLDKSSIYLQRRFPLYDYSLFIHQRHERLIVTRLRCGDISPVQVLNGLDIPVRRLIHNPRASNSHEWQYLTCHQRFTRQVFYAFSCLSAYESYSTFWPRGFLFQVICSPAFHRVVFWHNNG